IDNDIYFTVDACPNACEMWKAIERLKQVESINVQDLETNINTMENEHPEQPESSNDIYLAEHGDTNITIDSLDICYDSV
ncbi:hypothetical protein Tco_1536314, partial [Tanacetum coccineum]